MDKLKKCRICLVENVRMIVVADKNLQDIYEKLTDVPFVTEDSRPMLACFLCCSKLKQCYQLQRKCLEAEELFAQMLNDDYERKPLINQGLLEFRSGFTTTPTVHKGIVDECQTESIAIKEELPAVCEGLDDVIELKEEHQTYYELELENFDNSRLDVADIQVPPYHSQSDLSYNVPMMEFKTEVEEEQEVSKKKRRAGETTKLEPGNLDNSYVEILVPPYHSESDLEDNVPLMEFKTEVEKEQEVSKKKRRVGETTRATVAKKPTLDTGRTKLAITTEQTKKEKSDSKVETKDDLGENPYKCNVCQRSFSENNALTKHIDMYIHTTKPPKCDICERSFHLIGHLKRHILTHTGEKPYKCDVCQRSFADKGHLTDHYRIHTGKKPFKCDICERSFRQLPNLKRHILIHTGEKPYKCNVCQCSFRQNAHLISHIRTHTGAKPYKCDLCQRSFNEQSVLISHIRIHTGEKPFKCDICQRSFRQNGHLTEHIRKHTGEKPYPSYSKTRS